MSALEIVVTRLIGEIFGGTKPNATWMEAVERIKDLRTHIAELEKRNREIESYHLNHLGIPCDMTDPDIAVLQARIAELEALTQWQPIETAPKDGTVIRVSDLVGRERLASWYKESKYFDGHWMLKLEKIPEITHWMPLPKPPEEE